MKWVLVFGLLCVLPMAGWLTAETGTSCDLDLLDSTWAIPTVLRICEICGQKWSESAYSWLTPTDDVYIDAYTPVISSGEDTRNLHKVSLCAHCTKYDPDINAAIKNMLNHCREKERDRIAALKSAARRERLEEIRAEIERLEREREEME